LKWELGIVNKTHFTSVRELNDSNFFEFEKAILNLKQFSFDQYNFIIQQLNYDDFEKLLQEFTKEPYLNQILGAPHLNYPQIERMYLEINRRLVNYLTTVRIFLDYSETNLKRRYGKNSKQVTQFKKACSEAYNTYFAYRFVYELRNYAQHCKLPIQDLIIDSKIVEPSSNESSVSLRVMLNRDELLKNYNWKKLKREIKKLPSTFEINPLLAEVKIYLERINAITYEHQLVNLKESAKIIQFLIKPTKGMQGTPCVFKLKDESKILKIPKKQYQMDVIWIPLHLVDIVLQM